MAALTGDQKRKPLDIIILGGGIAGLTTALSLTKFAPADLKPRIRIFEIRPVPATIGGAVNLTPNALRLLDYLGALDVIRERNYGRTIEYLEVFDLYSGKLAENSFQGPNGEGIGNPPYKALRITRGDALKAVLATIEKHENISMTCDKRTTNIEETADKVILTFADGEKASADLLMGCDGIHSVTRLQHVDPERQSIYSGICNAFGFAPYKNDDFEVHFDCTALNFGRKGMLLTSFHSEAKDSVYVGGLMQVEDVGSRDGWKAKGQDAESVRAQMLERFATDARIECVRPLIERAQDFYLWPVYTLSKYGKWHTDRVMLLGDAAHAMPPQGESTGIVFEDGVIFSRVLSAWLDLPESKTAGGFSKPFEHYTEMRRPRIEKAYAESASVVRTVNDSGPWGHWLRTKIIPWYLWWSSSRREMNFEEDVTTSKLNLYALEL